MKILHKEIEFCDECPYQVIFDQFPYCVNAGKSLDSNNLIPDWCPLENDQRCEWTRDGDGDWDTECGNCYSQDEAGNLPSGYCNGCGKKIEVKDELEV